MTAASLFDQGINQVAQLSIPSRIYNQSSTVEIGRCSHVVEVVTNGIFIANLTANIAFIGMDATTCRADNVLRLKDEEGNWHDYRACLLKDTSLIRNGAHVWFINGNQVKQKGKVCSERFSNRDCGLRSVLLVERSDGAPGAISVQGDSGALVMLAQSADVLETQVVGMLIGTTRLRFHGEPVKEVTVANLLSYILWHLFSDTVEFADDRPARTYYVA